MLGSSRAALAAAGQQARLGATRTPARLPLRSPPTALAPRVKTLKTEPSKLQGVTASMPSGTALGASAGFGGILAIMKANPFASQVTIATCKTSLADIIAQKRVEGAEQIDWRRNIIFVMFGCFYLGGVQWMLYVRLFKRLFPSVETFCNQPLREKIKNKEGMKALFSQIGLDIIVFQPFMYFPVFYNFKTLMSTDPEVHASLSNHFSAAFARWRANFFEDNVGMSFFWFPADLVIYSVPVYLRLPLVHTVSFAWSCILSVFRGDTAHAKKLESA